MQPLAHHGLSFGHLLILAIIAVVLFVFRGRIGPGGPGGTSPA